MAKSPSDNDNVLYSGRKQVRCSVLLADLSTVSLLGWNRKLCKPGLRPPGPSSNARSEFEGALVVPLPLIPQSQRYYEFESQAEAVAKRNFGERIMDMMSIDGLGVHPDYQGKRYGSALLEAVTSKVRSLANLCCCQVLT